LKRPIAPLLRRPRNGLDSTSYDRPIASKLTPLAAVAALFALIPASASAVATRAEYVAAVNPICEDATRDVKQVRQRVRKTRGNPVAAAGSLNKGLGRVLGKLESRADDVVPAPGDEAAADRWLDSLDDARKGYLGISAQIARLTRQIKAGDAAGAQATAARIERAGKRQRKLSTKPPKLASQLGLSSCAAG
jgi:hypothetical protein